eukprot:2265957-Pyramimonas_sp.AAC.1
MGASSACPACASASCGYSRMPSAAPRGHHLPSAHCGTLASSTSRGFSRMPRAAPRGHHLPFSLGLSPAAASPSVGRLHSAAASTSSSSSLTRLLARSQLLW